MHSRRTAALAGLALLGLTGTAKAIPVDLELSLVIDSSGSINGIAIGGDDLLAYYQANVVGGVDASTLQASGFDEFDAAIARKIELEVGAPPPPANPEVVATPAPGALGSIGLGVFALGWMTRRRSLG